MNKKLLFLPISLLAIIALLQFGCDSDSDKNEDVCEAFPTPKECNTSTQATACCSDEDNCYYLYNGKRYAYTDAGQQELLSVMCPDLSKSQAAEVYKQLNAKTQKLLEQARMTAECY